MECIHIITHMLQNYLQPAAIKYHLLLLISITLHGQQVLLLCELVTTELLTDSSGFGKLSRVPWILLPC